MAVKSFKDSNKYVPCLVLFVKKNHSLEFMKSNKFTTKQLFIQIKMYCRFCRFWDIINHFRADEQSYSQPIYLNGQTYDFLLCKEGI